MLSPSMYSTPRSLNRSMRIFHCWKQCCSSSCVMLFKSYVASAFIASTDSNLVPLSADLIFGKRKKSHGARSGEYGGFSITGMLFFSKYLFTDSALCAGALSWWRIHKAFFHVWSPSSHTFTEGRQNIFIINLIDSLTFRHSINVDYPPGYRKKQSSLLWIWTCSCALSSS